MNFREFLNETPLSSYTTSFTKTPKEKEGFGQNRASQVYLGNDGKQVSIEDYFSKKDRFVISHPKTLKTLESRLSTSKHSFNILMIETHQSRPNEYRHEVEDFIARNNIQTNGHITFVKNGTTGHVMTPWMILHTIGHAVNEHTEDHYQPAFKRIVKNIAKSACREDNSPDPDELAAHDPKCMQKIGEIFMFKSANSNEDIAEGSFNVMAEFFNEFIAEFLWHGGRIRTKPNQTREVTENVRTLEKMIEEMLDLCVGQIIYDYVS